MALFTVFGAAGFIGRHVVATLEQVGHRIDLPPRRWVPDAGRNLGHVIFCAGVTADFRSRPYDTMEAHVSLPAGILSQGTFESFLYLSSTRIYDGAPDGDEAASITVNPADASDLYNLSKLSGEALCLNHPDPAVRVARLSNVYGADMFADDIGNANFLAGILGEAVVRGHIDLATDPSSAKDYIDVADVARAIVTVAQQGDERIYNIAAGRKVSHGEIAARLQDLTGCATTVAENAPVVDYPDISTRRIAGLFNGTGSAWSPAALTDRLPGLVSAARESWRIKEGALA